MCASLLFTQPGQGRARIIHETPVPINYNARFSSPIPPIFMRTDDFDFFLPERLIAQRREDV